MASADLVIAFDARIGNLEAALRRTETSLRRTEQQAKETGSAMAAALTAGASSAGNSLLLLSRNLLGVGLGFLALQRAGQAIGGALSAIDALADEAASIGATTNQLRALQVAFEEAGGNGDKAADAFGKLNNIIGQAGDGTESAIATLTELYEAPLTSSMTSLRSCKAWSLLRSRWPLLRSSLVVAPPAP
jgi:hypothetical protein